MGDFNFLLRSAHAGEERGAVKQSIDHVDITFNPLVHDLLCGG
jgi:hypothetical protein